MILSLRSRYNIKIDLERTMLSQNGSVRHVCAFAGSIFFAVRARNFLTNVVYTGLTNWTNFRGYRQIAARLRIKILKQKLCSVSGNLEVK
jgi:hypothetical protein